MYIVIIGLGKVGQLLTQYLSNEGHDVVVIDQNSKKVEDIVNQYDVLGLCGNGANNEILMEAGVEKADAVISVTASDELNILAGLICKQHGTKNTIARVRNPDYSRQNQFLREKLGFSLIVNPELEAANEIRRMIMFSSAMKVDYFAKGKIELIELKIAEKIRLGQLKLNELSQVTKASVLICAVRRGEEVIIPNGDFILKDKDHIYVTGSHRDLLRFCLDVGFMSEKIKNVIIVGGSKIAYYLSRQLAVQGIQTKIIETNHQRCVELSKKLPYSIIIEGNGTDEEILLEEGIKKSDAIVSLTGFDEENIILSLLAKKLGVKKAIAKVNRINLNAIIDELNLDNIIDPKSFVASQIIGYLRAKANNDDSTSVQTLYKLVNDQVEALEFVVNEKTKHLHQSLMDIKMKNHILIAGILRNNEMIIPKGHDTLEINDRIIIVSSHSSLKNLNDIFDGDFYE